MSPLAEEDELERIWKSEYSLSPLVAPDQFKSYAELSARLDKVLNTGISIPEEDMPTFESRAVSKTAEAKSSPSKNAVHEDEDDTLAMFEKLARD